LPIFLADPRLRPFIDLKLAAALSSPIEFIPKHGGRSAFDINAELIPAICDVWLKAREAGDKVLTKAQKRIAQRAELLTRGLAHGVLVDLKARITALDRERSELEGLIAGIEHLISSQSLP